MKKNNNFLITSISKLRKIKKKNLQIIKKNINIKKKYKKRSKLYKINYYYSPTQLCNIATNNDGIIDYLKILVKNKYCLKITPDTKEKDIGDFIKKQLE